MTSTSSECTSLQWFVKGMSGSLVEYEFRVGGDEASLPPCRIYGGAPARKYRAASSRCQRNLQTAQRVAPLRDCFHRARYDCWYDTPRSDRLVVLGYVIMPEHFHRLMSESQEGDPSKVMQVVKQRFAQCILRRARRRTCGSVCGTGSRVTCGRRAFTISMCGPSASALRSAVHAWQSGETRTFF